MTEFLHSSDWRYQPIPTEVPSVAGWKEIPIIEPEVRESLEPVGPFSGNEELMDSSIYFGSQQNSPYPEDALEGALLTTFARREVIQQLRSAQRNLPYGMHVVIYDAYRPVNVQRALYDHRFEEARREHPEWSDQQLTQDTQRFVSLPASPDLDPKTRFVSPHLTGGAIDLLIFRLKQQEEVLYQHMLTELKNLPGGAWQKAYELNMKMIGLVNKNAVPLNFGTTFDFVGEETELNFYEKLEMQRPLTTSEKEAQKNRRLLYNVMTAAGFEPYADEWWHYNSKKTQMGAKTARLSHAEYGAIELSGINKRHEAMRKNHRLGTLKIVAGVNIPPVNIAPEAERVIVAFSGAKDSGDMRQTCLTKAEII